MFPYEKVIIYKKKKIKNKKVNYRIQLKKKINKTSNKKIKKLNYYNSNRQ